MKRSVQVYDGDGEDHRLPRLRGELSFTVGLCARLNASIRTNGGIYNNIDRDTIEEVLNDAAVLFEDNKIWSDAEVHRAVDILEGTIRGRIRELKAKGFPSTDRIEQNSGDGNNVVVIVKFS